MGDWMAANRPWLEPTLWIIAGLSWLPSVVRWVTRPRSSGEASDGK